MSVSICAKRTVAEVLESYPQTAASFLALKTNCAGCHLARFCTLEDVARTYELAPPDLIDALQRTSQSLQKE
jgi:hybrid cluster-associated redox disulfide protein